MDKAGRVRLNITRNSKGFSYEFTFDEEGTSPKEVLAKAEAFKDLVEAKVEQWTIDLTEKNVYGA